VRLWTSTLARPLEPHDGWIRAVSFDARGDRLASAGEDAPSGSGTRSSGATTPTPHAAGVRRRPPPQPHPTAVGGVLAGRPHHQSCPRQRCDGRRLRAADRARADEDGLPRLVVRLGPDIHGSIETMSGAVWVRDRLAECGWTIEVADARTNKAIAPGLRGHARRWTSVFLSVAKLLSATASTASQPPDASHTGTRLRAAASLSSDAGAERTAGTLRDSHRQTSSRSDVL
jgi:hypothetical protein